MSILETENGKITSFHADFDRQNLSRQITEQIGGRRQTEVREKVEQR